MTEVNVQDNSKKSRWPLILGLGIVIAGLFGGGLLYARSLTEASQASADAMPPDTLFYASIDAINLLDPQNLKTLNDGFGELFGASGVETGSQEDVYKQFDEPLAPYGISFDDIRPWIGRSIGLGIGTLRMTESGPTPTSYLIVAEIRDEAAADDFLAKFESANQTDRVTYQGVDYLTETAQSFSRVHIGRSQSLMIWASDPTAFEHAVDAQSGESLTDLPAYNDFLAKLPEQRALTFIAFRQGIEALQNEFIRDEDSMFALGGSVFEPQQLAQLLENSDIDIYDAVGGSVRVAPSGIEVDLVSLYDPETLSAEQRERMSSTNNMTESAPEGLPGNTMFYVGGAGIGNRWEFIKNGAWGSVDEEDFEDAMTLAEQILGFSIEDDLIPQLQGDFGLALYQNENSPLASIFNVNVGVMLKQGVKDSAEAASILTRLNAALEDQGLLVSTLDDVTSIDMFGMSIANYGVNNGSLIISTYRNDVTDSRSSAESLTANPLFITMKELLPEDMNLIFFADTQVILSTIGTALGEGETRQLVVDAIPVIGMGTRVDEDGATSRIIFGVQD